MGSPMGRLERFEADVLELGEAVAIELDDEQHYPLDMIEERWGMVEYDRWVQERSGGK